MEKVLKDFSPGETGVVLKISNVAKIKRRLYDMGVTPLGDPLCVLLRGYELSVRKDEAAEVVMEVKK